MYVSPCLNCKNLDFWNFKRIFILTKVSHIFHKRFTTVTRTPPDLTLSVNYTVNKWLHQIVNKWLKYIWQWKQKQWVTIVTQIKVLWIVDNTFCIKGHLWKVIMIYINKEWKRNFKWPFRQRWQCPIHDGTGKRFVWSSMD